MDADFDVDDYPLILPNEESHVLALAFHRCHSTSTAIYVKQSIVRDLFLNVMTEFVKRYRNEKVTQTNNSDKDLDRIHVQQQSKGTVHLCIDPLHKCILQNDCCKSLDTWININLWFKRHPQYIWFESSTKLNLKENSVYNQT